MNCISELLYFHSNSNKKYECIYNGSMILVFTMAIALGILGLYSAYGLLTTSTSYTALYFGGGALFFLLGLVSLMKSKKPQNKVKVVSLTQRRLRPRRLFP